MAKPLDGIALQAYVRGLGFPRETQKLLTQSVTMFADSNSSVTR